MGNTTSFAPLPPAFKNLNEDNMVVLLQYLDIPDFVHLTQTSKKLLYETLGPNNYLWAQLLNRPVPVQYASFQQFDLPAANPNTRLANHVLQTTRNGRKFAVDGVPLNLSVPVDIVNKQFVNHFDFKSEIKTFYFLAKCVQNLRGKMAAIAHGTTAASHPDIRVMSDINLKDYDVKSDVATDRAVTDVTFVVDLTVNADALEKMQQSKLPGMYCSRRVVYVQTPVLPQPSYVYFSRSRAMPPQPPPQYMLAANYPYPVLQPQPYLSYPPPGQPVQLQPGVPQPPFQPPQPFFGAQPYGGGGHPGNVPSMPAFVPHMPQPSVPQPQQPQPGFGAPIMFQQQVPRPPPPQQQQQQVQIQQK